MENINAIQWLDYPEHEPELVFFKGTMSAWFIALPHDGGAPIMLRIIQRVPGELHIIDRSVAKVWPESPEKVIRKWFPIPPDENGKIY